LNHEKHAQETRFENAGRIVPFIEVLIPRGVLGSFLYRLAQRLKSAYQELMFTLGKTIEDDVFQDEIAKAI
jgi:hypothetical protein